MTSRNRMMGLGLGLFFSIAMAAGLARAAGDELSIAIPITPTPPAMDGTLDAKEWQGAAAVTDFSVLEGKQTGQKTTNITVRVMRDDQWLYVGFDIRHPQPTTIVPKMTQRDSRVQGENCVKVAFDPGTEGKLWYHLRLSAGNVKSDQRSVAGSGELGWNCPWRSATRITDQGWQAELAIPFAVVMEMGEPEKARINFLAHVYEPILDPYKVEIGQEREVWSWAPVAKTWWRTPGRFGKVTGLEGAVFKAPFLPEMESVEVGAYRCEDGKYAYDVAVAARNASSMEGAVMITVHDQPEGGASMVTNNLLALKPNEAAKISVAVPVDSVRRRSVRVEMISKDTGEVLDRALIENPPVLDLFSAYLDRNYYTTEAEARVVCQTGLPAEGLKDTVLMVKGPDGKTLGETRAVAARTEVTLPLKDTGVGSHSLSVEHRRGDGALISEQKLELVKRAPKPGLEWKIDRVNRMLLHDGQPQFVYGILMGGDRAAYNEENYREVAEAGFNAVLYWCSDGSLEAIFNALDTMKQQKMFMCLPVCKFATPPEFNPTNLPPGIRPSNPSRMKGQVMDLPTRPERNRVYADVYRQAAPLIRNGIEAVKNHPALMAYEGFDEPLNDSWFDQYVQGRELYKLIYDTDGYHPKRVLWGFPPEGEKYTDWSDFLAGDPYWSPPVGVLRHSPQYVAKQAARFAARGEKERKPVWLTPVLEMYSGHYKRSTLPGEQRAQTWLAIIHKASGLFYFVYPVRHQTTWDTMKQMGREFKELNPILAAPIPDQQITYEPAGFDPDKDILPDVHVSLRSNPAGGYVLLAANSQPWAVDARFSLSVLGESGKVRQMFGNKTWKIDKGAFAERLEPFATRAYVISEQPVTASSPNNQSKIENQAPPERFAQASLKSKIIDITVREEARKEGYQPETEVPRAGRPGKRNIMSNPSFEEAALAGHPDYWWFHAARYPEERTGRVKAMYCLDEDKPFHGKVAFRLTASSNRSCYSYFKLSPQHDRTTEYVWSAWMRADRDGVKAQWGGLGVNKKKAVFELTREWKRYQTDVSVPANAERHASYFMSMGGGETGARIWIDAMQFERGVEPTEFEP